MNECQYDATLLATMKRCAELSALEYMCTANDFGLKNQAYGSESQVSNEDRTSLIVSRDH